MRGSHLQRFMFSGANIQRRFVPGGWTRQQHSSNNNIKCLKAFQVSHCALGTAIVIRVNNVTVVKHVRLAGIHNGLRFAKVNIRSLTRGSVAWTTLQLILYLDSSVIGRASKINNIICQVYSCNFKFKTLKM